MSTATKMPEEDEMAVTSEQVREVLEREEPDYEAAAQLGSDALPHLQRFVESGDPNLAPKAAYLAGRIGDSQASPILELAATSDDPGTRVAAATRVRYLPDEQADNVLLPLLDDDVTAVRKEALKAVPTTPSQDLADKIEVLREYESEPALRELAAEVFDRTSGQGEAPTP
jgi:HEAT repeat protein